MFAQLWDFPTYVHNISTSFPRLILDFPDFRFISECLISYHVDHRSYAHPL